MAEEKTADAAQGSAVVESAAEVPRAHPAKHDRCIFCRIKEPELKAKIVFESEELLAFHDIRPDAAVHYLVIPREHIRNVNTLDASHIPLIKRMVDVGEKLLESHAGGRQLGFHVPPFYSIDHLHLHVLGLPYRSTKASWFHPQKNTFYHYLPEYLIERLQKKQAVARV